MLDRLAHELAALRDADQLRGLANPSGIQLGSNDYLGLSTHPRLRTAIVAALEEDERFCSTGSRLLTGNHERWDRLETDFARFVRADAALYSSVQINAVHLWSICSVTYANMLTQMSTLSRDRITV